MTRDIIKSGTAAWCDQYHFTMAGAWFDCGKHLEHKTSEAFFRRMPHNCGYVLTSGLGEFLEWIDNWHISRENLDYLRSCKNRIGGQLFSNEFLDFLKGQKLSVDIKAVPEGEVVFAGEPLLSVSGPCWQVEMVEAAYLNVINAQCPIATKAARTVQASAADGKKRPVLEMGLRRATELGGLTSSRAALIGGCAQTSNVYAAQHLNLQGAGTMAHSWILSFEREVDAFKAYLHSYPYDGILLVDTYDTRQGLKNAIRASDETGIPLLGVRIDSGDLAYWSKEARNMLNQSGHEQTLLIASNDLDEFVIENLVAVQKAEYDVFGAGTKIVTADDFEALGGVYKTKEYLGQDKIKIAAGKTTVPGKTNVLRVVEKGLLAGDIIVRQDNNWLYNGKINGELTSYKLNSPEHQSKKFAAGTEAYPLLKDVVIGGHVKPEYLNLGIEQLRQRAKSSLSQLGEEYKRLRNPHLYVVGQEAQIEQRQTELIRQFQQWAGR